MLNGANSIKISSDAVIDWMIDKEPELVKKIYDHFFQADINISFDSGENTRRLKEVSRHIEKHSAKIYQSLSRNEKLLLYILKNSFGWIVYENFESTMKIAARIFKMDYQDLVDAVESLFRKFLLFKYERLKRYNFIFSPPVFLRNIEALIDEKEFFSAGPGGDELKPAELSTYQYLSLIAGLISYVVTYSPRSSETNEIHKIDLNKMLEFFSDFSEDGVVEKIIKKLSRFGFFQKVNNRIIINKNLFDSILNLSINEQLFIVFLYDFMDKFDFRQSAFMTLKILALRNLQKKAPISLRELFFYYLNNEIYLTLKNEVKNVKLLLQQEELKFIFFIKNLELENCVLLKKSDPDKISIAGDFVIMNEPHSSLLNNIDFSSHFKEDQFIIEPNFEVIVEPYLKPSVLFKLAIMTEPVTIQTISLFRITKESIYRSLAYGIEKEEILDFLTRHSRHKIPENVASGINSFISDLTMEKLGQYKIIQVNAHFSSLVKDNFKNRLIEVEPHTFLIFDSEISDKIVAFCKENRYSYKFIEDFLNHKYLDSIIKNSLSHNIKHLHTMKDFFDFYGTLPSGSNIKIDNKI